MTTTIGKIIITITLLIAMGVETNWGSIWLVAESVGGE